MTVNFVDVNREEFGVEPICTVLQIAPSTYYSAKTRPRSVRAVRDEALTALMLAVFAANYSVYGARKLHKAMIRAGHQIGRDQLARLMRQAGIRGVRRGRKVFTTRPDPGASRSPGLCLFHC